MERLEALDRALPAGSRLKAVASVTDAKGNPVDVPVTIATDIPNAFVAGNMIADITVAGKYQVVGDVQGTGVSGARAVTIEPGPAKKIHVSANPPISFAGQPVFITAIATDEYGNQLPATALMQRSFHVSLALAAGGSEAGASDTFNETFDQSGMALPNLSSATANNLNETYSYFVDNAANNRRRTLIKRLTPLSHLR